MNKIEKYIQWATLFETKKGFVYYDKKSMPTPFLVAVGDIPDEGRFKTLREAKLFLQNYK